MAATRPTTPVSAAAAAGCADGGDIVEMSSRRYPEGSTSRGVLVSSLTLLTTPIGTGQPESLTDSPGGTGGPMGSRYAARAVRSSRGSRWVPPSRHVHVPNPSPAPHPPARRVPDT